MFEELEEILEVTAGKPWLLPESDAAIAAEWLEAEGYEEESDDEQFDA